jgi:hypothetical protein
VTPEEVGGVRHTDKVTILEVEAVQLVARLLRIHHILIDNECRALGVVGNALADLARYRQYAATSHAFSNLPDWTKLAEEVEELLRGDVVAAAR